MKRYRNIKINTEVEEYDDDDDLLLDDDDFYEDDIPVSYTHLFWQRPAVR